MAHFLLIYNLVEQKLLAQREFAKPRAASEAYEEAERAYMGDPAIQVVLVAAKDIESVRVTHGNFFERTDVDELLRELTSLPR